MSRVTPMTLGPQNADDSCLVNKTVPAGDTPVQPVQTKEKPTVIDEGGKESAPPPPSVRNSASGDDSGAEGGTRAEAEADAEDDADFPEGGLAAWLVVLGSFCAMISVYGIINSAAVFESYFTTHQLAEYDSSTIGWIFSTYLFIVFFAGIQVGPIFDRRGPRLIVAVGSLLVIASQLLLGLCEGKCCRLNHITVVVLTMLTYRR